MRHDIKIVRGTTKQFDIKLKNSDGTARILSDGEYILLGAKLNVNDETLAVSKQINSAAYDAEKGSYAIIFVPSDTKELTVGKYHYDAGIVSGAHVYPIIEDSMMEISQNIISV